MGVILGASRGGVTMQKINAWRWVFVISAALWLSACTADYGVKGAGTTDSGNARAKVKIKF